MSVIGRTDVFVRDVPIVWLSVFVALERTAVFPGLSSVTVQRSVDTFISLLLLNGVQLPSPS